MIHVLHSISNTHSMHIIHTVYHIICISCIIFIFIDIHISCCAFHAPKPAKTLLHMSIYVQSYQATSGVGKGIIQGN